MNDSQPNSRLKYPGTDFRHHADIQTRFGDYDVFGHINNNSYMAFFDIGKTAYFNTVMGRSCSPVDLCAAIVNVNVDFLAPTVMNEPLQVLTKVVNIGSRSITVYQRIVNPLTSTVKAQAVSILAGFDIATQGPGDINPDFINAIHRLED